MFIDFCLTTDKRRQINKNQYNPTSTNYKILYFEVLDFIEILHIK